MRKNTLIVNMLSYYIDLHTPFSFKLHFYGSTKILKDEWRRNLIFFSDAQVLYFLKAFQPQI